MSGFTAVVFSGPTLGHETVCEILDDPICKPPAAMGDVRRDPAGETPDSPLVTMDGTVVGTPAVLRSIHMRSRLEQSRTRELRAEREALAAQVQGLQARIEPIDSRFCRSHSGNSTN